MQKMRSLVTIQHSPVAKDKQAREDRKAGLVDVPQTTVNPGDTFNPADLQLTDADVAKMVAAGHIVAADDRDAIRPSAPGEPSVTQRAEAPGWSNEPLAASK